MSIVYPQQSSQLRNESRSQSMTNEQDLIL